jgi:platelet-activating factor acetylhydrolase IB subunit alpha
VGDDLVSVSKDKTIRIWDVSNGSCIKVLEGHVDWIRCVCLSESGKLLATAGTDQVFQLYQRLF